MEINKTAFYPILLDILTDISEAHFITFDLELSGVVSKGNGGSSKGAGKPTLQERYLETKEAAERYAILQIGLTCVQQDVENEKYVLKPYNFNLNPIMEERGLDIERIFSYQSGAVEFLLKVGFDMSKPFTEGVPYMSRSEARMARDKAAKRNNKSDIADIQIKPTETESLAFLARVRTEIADWTSNTSANAPGYLNIGATETAEGMLNGESPPELSKYEKRLVHQLVRAEHPELVTFSKRGFIQIVRFDKEREDRYAASRKKELNERINRQKGFRHIIEAMLGNDLSQLDLRECARDPVTGEHVFYDIDAYRATFNRAQALLRHHAKVIVGHNCFLDLVYIYRHFIGPLPETVTEYAEKLHNLWPMVVDTKYMATHNCGDINPVSSLEQIASQLSTTPTPALELADEHKKYELQDAHHEAGFDSYLTAQIAVRLSSKLAEAQHGQNGDESSGDDGVGGVSLDELELDEHPSFSGGMPDFGDEFWRVYGNKLRVFGTEEGVCRVDAGS